jgi:hypothetical protein
MPSNGRKLPWIFVPTERGCTYGRRGKVRIVYVMVNLEGKWVGYCTSKSRIMADAKREGFGVEIGYVTPFMGRKNLTD